MEIEWGGKKLAATKACLRGMARNQETCEGIEGRSKERNMRSTRNESKGTASKFLTIEIAKPTRFWPGLAFGASS